MRQESAYLAALETAARYEIQGNELMLRRDDGAQAVSYVASTTEMTTTTEMTGTTEMTTTSEITTTFEMTAASELIGIVWAWQDFQGGDGSTITVDDPSRYTIQFFPDGQVGVQADCNSASGSYRVDNDSMLEIEMTVMTMAMCPEGSLSDEFIRNLNATTHKDIGARGNYVRQGNELFINLVLDSGQMRFLASAPAGE
jgi:heat shock protein HslJ